MDGRRGPIVSIHDDRRHRYVCDESVYYLYSRSKFNVTMACFTSNSEREYNVVTVLLCVGYMIPFSQESDFSSSDFKLSSF